MYDHASIRVRSLALRLKGIRIGLVGILLLCLLSWLGSSTRVHASGVSSEQQLYTTEQNALTPTYSSSMTTADSGNWTVGNANNSIYPNNVCDYDGGSYELYVPGIGSTANSDGANCLASGIASAGTTTVQVQYTATSGNVGVGKGDWLGLRVNQFFFDVSLLGYTNLDNSVYTNPGMVYRSGLNQINTLTLIEQGQNAYAYINGVFVSKDSNGLPSLSNGVALWLSAGDINSRVHIQNVQVRRPPLNRYISGLVQQDSGQWDTNTTCTFSQNTYHVIDNTNGTSAYCMAQGLTFDNSVIRVGMTINSGSGGGVRFRADTAGNGYYQIRINTDGSYALTSSARTLMSGTASTSVIKRGLGKTNALDITAWQNILTIYVNGYMLGGVTDANNVSTIGEVGFFAVDDGSAADVSFAGTYMQQPVLLYASALSQQDSAQWDTGTDAMLGSCGFTHGSYTVTEGTNGYYKPCMAENTSLSYDNLRVQVDMTMNSGNGGGLIFRSGTSGQDRWHIGQNHSFDVTLSNGSRMSGTNPVINAGNGSVNKMRILALQTLFKLYVNGHFIGSISDVNASVTAGGIGFFALDNTNTAASVSFSNLWILQ